MHRRLYWIERHTPCYQFRLSRLRPYVILRATELCIMFTHQQLAAKKDRRVVQSSMDDRVAGADRTEAQL